MRKGINRADFSQEYERLSQRILAGLRDEEFKLPEPEPCIFVSYKNEDREMCRMLVEYIKDAGVDVFFDEENKLLKDDKMAKNPETVTAIINGALKKSTHMIIVISERTKESWWVPYEIGFTWNKSDFDRRNVVMLLKSDIDEVPGYLYLVKRIESSEDLDEFLKDVQKGGHLLNESEVRRSFRHPMKKILK